MVDVLHLLGLMLRKRFASKHWRWSHFDGHLGQRAGQGHLDVCGGDVVPVVHQLRIFNIKSINSQVISISHIRTHKIIFFEISNTKYALISVFAIYFFVKNIDL